MPADTTSDDESEEPETITISTDTELTVAQEAIRQITTDIAIHKVVDDSEYDRAIVGSDADSEERLDQIGFGSHEDELPAPL